MRGKGGKKGRKRREWVWGERASKTGAMEVREIWGAVVGGAGRSTDQHFPQAWAQACESTNVLKNLNWDLLRTNAVMC